MRKMNWTDEQSRAIHARGGNLLLSAAAGSGKTTVLVERVLTLILEEGGTDIDRMLIVTFTRAAAADMRSKLSREMAKRASQGSARCREQMLKLAHASITNLHSFCADFLRTHFEAAGVDPAFRVLDDPIAARLLDEALDETLEDAYADRSPELDRLDYGRGPKKVRELVGDMYRTLAQRSDPKAWLEKIDEDMISAWMKELTYSAHGRILLARSYSVQAIDHEGCPEHYEKALKKDIEIYDEMLAIGEYDPLCRRLQAFKPTQPRGRNTGVDEADLNAVQDLRKKAKDAISPDRVAMCALPAAQSIADARDQLAQVKLLGALAMEVMRRYDEKKAELSGLTYDDLETKTLAALSRDDVAAAMREQYDYVFVDEYQDTSEIQEAIVARLSRGDNRFMVGDVKQSIYRFRQAEPKLFMNYYRDYLGHDGGTLLPLTRNFRSKPEVLSFTNMIFERTMTGGYAEITYEVLALLIPVRDASDPGAPVEIHLLERKADEDTDEEIADLRAAEQQGLFIARRIQKMMADDPTLRYRDFAVLTRSKSSAFTPMLPMLLSAGIPAYADGASGFYESMEISLTLSMLRLIANERSDVELIAVLHSPVVGLTADELARLRIQDKNIPYVDAARKYVSEHDDALAGRIRAFFGTLSSWRLRAGGISLGELVRAVLDESGFYVYAGALPGGAQRQANLDALVTAADRFDSEESGSLVRFLAHTDRMQRRGDGDAAHLLGENDDVVRMMTVHKSKGLEFKIVFGAILEKPFGGAKWETLSAHPELGAGMDYYDAERRTRRRTLAQAAITERKKREDAAEEMRVLYVMLTRAQDRLILTAGVRDIEKAMKRWDALGPNMRACGCHLDIIMAARASAVRDGEDTHSILTRHDLNELSGADQTEYDPMAALREILDHSDQYADPAMEAELSWQYPDELAAKKPLKLTASGLIREIEGPSQLPQLVERPAFLQGEKRLTGAERGTAYHRAMQILNFASLRGLSTRQLIDAIRIQLDDAERAHLMSDVQREVVRPTLIAAFFEGPVGKRLLAAQDVKKEWPFNVLLRAGEALDPGEAGAFSSEEILVQGTIDCCFVEDGKWILLDYKTDRGDDLDAIRRHYEKQLRVYALALERITGIPVREKLLCLLGINQTLSID